MDEAIQKVTDSYRSSMALGKNYVEVCIFCHLYGLYMRHFKQAIVQEKYVNCFGWSTEKPFDSSMFSTEVWH